MRAVAFLLLASLPSVAASVAPVPKHLMKDAETEQSKLQGKWKLEAMRLDGADIPEPSILKLVFEIKGDSFIASSPDRITTGKFKLESSNGLKVLTTTGSRSGAMNGNPGKKEDDVSFGYLINGDKLSIAMKLPSEGGNPTPADPAKPGNTDLLMVLIRVKDQN